MRNSIKLVVLLMPLLLTVSGCETLGVDLGQINLVSTEEEVRLGKNLAVEVEKEQPVLDNPALTRYVNEVGMNVARWSDRRDVPYSFKVIDNDESVNAFALPGGPIYVYTGLLKYAENEAELAGVLGHEVAHIAARHSTEQLTKAFGYSLLADIVLGKDPGAAAGMARDIIGSLGMLKFSRSDEIESDRLGVRYLYQAGYSPHAMTSFLQKLGKLQSENPSRVLNLLSTHPLSDDRMNAVRGEIATLPPGKKVGYYTERYTEIIGRELK
jgi:predicted Zn-dependent protease